MRLALALFALLSFTGVHGAARADATYFNHGYVNVAPATFDAIRTSPFVIDSLGAAESRTVVAGAGKPGWSGFYLYGERTYLEFFPAGQGDPLGKIGLGLSIDDRRQLPELAKRLSASAGVPFPLGRQTRTIEGVEIDWFDAIGPDYGAAANPLLDLWVMGLFPSYLRQRFPGLTATEDGVTREKMLARQYRPDLLLKNVMAVSLVLSETERGRLIKELEGAGYVIIRRGTSQEASGPEFRFLLSPVSAQHPRSVTYHLALNRRAASRTLTFGASTLTIRPDATATWHFPAEGDPAK